MKGLECPTKWFILSLKREQLWNIWLQGIEISKKTVLKRLLITPRVDPN